MMCGVLFIEYVHICMHERSTKYMDIIGAKIVEEDEDGVGEMTNRFQYFFSSLFQPTVPGGVIIRLF